MLISALSCLSNNACAPEPLDIDCVLSSMSKKVPLKVLIDTGITNYWFIDECTAQDVCSVLGIQPNPLSIPKPIRGFDGHLAKPITYAIYLSLTIQFYPERTTPLLITRLGQHHMIPGKI
jgi:hypothetical protein